MEILDSSTLDLMFIGDHLYWSPEAIQWKRILFAKGINS